MLTRPPAQGRSYLDYDTWECVASCQRSHLQLNGLKVTEVLLTPCKPGESRLLFNTG